MQQNIQKSHLPPPPLIFSGIKNNGFTLIELLVVVLITGILAAIALPQYQTAVLKAQSADTMTTLSTVLRMQEYYYLVNRKYTANPKELDIEFPEFVFNPPATLFCNTTRYCSLRTNDKLSFEFTFKHPTEYTYRAGRRFCIALNGNAAAKKVCQFYGGVLNDEQYAPHVYYRLP